MLGQLGLGRLGAGKGRLLPTLLCVTPTEGDIVDIGAGANFSVAVTSLGEVFSWG